MLLPAADKAFVIGVTGPPGAGKSTLIDVLIAAYRERGGRVGVLAVDPSSPISGGALLGDRIRMQRHATDSGVFIRSFATRGAMGGLSRSVYDAVVVLDSMGFHTIFVETVGVGQDEVDVAAAADLTIVVTVPGLGDGVQAIKAGVLEVADVLVVNKADLPGVDNVVRDLQAMVEIRQSGRQDVAIVKTVAAEGKGHLRAGRDHRARTRPTRGGAQARYSPTFANSVPNSGTRATPDGRGARRGRRPQDGVERPGLCRAGRRPDHRGRRGRVDRARSGWRLFWSLIGSGGTIRNVKNQPSVIRVSALAALCVAVLSASCGLIDLDSFNGVNFDLPPQSFVVDSDSPEFKKPSVGTVPTVPCTGSGRDHVLRLSRASIAPRPRCRARRTSAPLRTPSSKSQTIDLGMTVPALKQAVAIRPCLPLTSKACSTT